MDTYSRLMNIEAYLLFQLALQLHNSASQLLNDFIGVGLTPRQLLRCTLLVLYDFRTQMSVLPLQFTQLLLHQNQLRSQLLTQLRSISCSDACQCALAVGRG